jgi:hypothetical protein
MDITYKKINNSQLFENFKNIDLLNMQSCQNYIPLYNNFFKLTKNNYNNINLNNKYTLNSITNKFSENKYKGSVILDDDSILEKNVFFKFSPLLDPYKYLAGKYDISDNKLFILPKLEDNKCYEKVCDPNNSAYVDSFFTYLTSQLLNHKDFIHGLDFYGSYLGIKNEYHIDICDDIDMLAESDFFHENKHLYKFINKEHEEIFNDQSRSNKKPIELGNDIEDCSILNLEDIENLDNEILNIEDNDNTDTGLLYENTNINNISKSKTASDSDISSRSSNTDNNDNNDNKDNNDNNDIESSSNSESSSDSEADAIMLSINKFPVQIISLECCENTFDNLLANDELDDDELTCIIIQILMTLITYQKLFSLTHNDLHTNNIMFVKTDKKYLYYKYNDKHYKVPTFGKIFKIIDFGRAIYKYKDITICSDSFHKDGDAATQYNCEPYYNNNKPIVEPNMSFDLCRLGCSIYDFIISEYDTPNSKMRPIHKIITDWCVDDSGRNILYKNNDEERYPDFKLYKMIARKVHNHLPDKELNNKIFNKYIVPKREIKKGSKIMNIDIINLDSI